MHNDAVANDTHLGAVGNLALEYIAACDFQLGNSNQLTNLYAALNNLFELRSQHTFDSCFYIVNCVIDNAVGADINLFSFSSLTSVCVRTNVEADDQRICCGSQGNVGLVDSSNACMDNSNLNLIVLNLL